MKGMSSAEADKLSMRMCNDDAHFDELDVFEAAVYFSGGCNAAKEENRRRSGMFGGERRRISLDLPIRCSEQVTTTTKERISNVRYKQPSSPGGKFVSFINSLFHQAGSKKNMSKSKSKEQELEEEIQGEGWMRRRRRSSISHFLSSSRSNSTTTRTSSSSKPLFSSSSSGFRTPPPCLNTPTKNNKQFLNYTCAKNQEEKKLNKELCWLDETLKVIESLSEKKEGDDNDDAMESDSSSDLFELQNYKT